MAPLPDSDRRFISARPLDSRAPCPALNALANHGYLPRDGKNISFWQLIQALRLAYNLSFPLAVVLTLVGLIFCGHGFLWLDLNTLAIHNRIEHDASLVHCDAVPGSRMAPTVVEQGLLHSLLSYASTKRGLRLRDLAKARVDREARLIKPLAPFHAQIARGEVALTWLIMKDENGIAPTDMLRQWMGDERLPHNWTRPTHCVGLREARQMANIVTDEMKKVKERKS